MVLNLFICGTTELVELLCRQGKASCIATMPERDTERAVGGGAMLCVEVLYCAGRRKEQARKVELELGIGHSQHGRYIFVGGKIQSGITRSAPR